MKSYQTCPIISVRGEHYRCSNCKENWVKGSKSCSKLRKVLINKLFTPFYNDISSRPYPSFRCKGIHASKIPDPFKEGFKEIIANKVGALNKFIYFDIKYGKMYYRPTDAFINILKGDQDIDDLLREL